LDPGHCGIIGKEEAVRRFDTHFITV
jgi:hypothetical protein